jgi:hypothetical protein
MLVLGIGSWCGCYYHRSILVLGIWYCTGNGGATKNEKTRPGQFLFYLTAFMILFISILN